MKVTTTSARARIFGAPGKGAKNKSSPTSPGSRKEVASYSVWSESAGESQQIPSSAVAAGFVWAREAGCSAHSLTLASLGVRLRGLRCVQLGCSLVTKSYPTLFRPRKLQPARLLCP